MTTPGYDRPHALLAFCATILPFFIGANAAIAKDDAYLARLPQDEVVYFVLPDRFENADTTNDHGGFDGDRLTHGFDPTHKGFFHGGDLKGLTSKLDYIQSLGATAIWLGPIYKNKPVQGPPGDESAGYHGYWITDFTTVDPHFGTEADLKEFVDAAHKRGMKIYLDIITNHTADVISFQECHDPDYRGADKTVDVCPYRSKADFPYNTRGAVDGTPINNGFMGDGAAYQTPENFEKLNRADHAYTPQISESEKSIKNPNWLNDPIYYHNRGDSFWVGESALYGDFGGLDDLMTEHPRVLEGMIDIFQHWITKYRIDGFRVDTARHVAPEFWRAFNEAIVAHAIAEGIPNFYVFGEAYSPNAAGLARFTRVDGFPTVLDFAFQSTVQDVVVNGAPATRFADLFDVDDLYDGGPAATQKLPVFVGNHDMGRFAMFVRQKHPDISDRELLSRVAIAHAMMFFLRGVPVIYYGDEQGFNGDGNDQASREDMFPSKVASYNDNDLAGTDTTTAVSNFNKKHPLYKAFANMAGIYESHDALRRGTQIVRAAEHEGALLAVSRLGDAGEYLIAFNPSPEDREAQFVVDPRSETWRSVYGSCEPRSSARESYRVSIPAWGYVICRSNDWSTPE